MKDCKSKSRNIYIYIFLYIYREIKIDQKIMLVLCSSEKSKCDSWKYLAKGFQEGDENIGAFVHSFYESFLTLLFTLLTACSWSMNWNRCEAEILVWSKERKACLNRDKSSLTYLYRKVGRIHLSPMGTLGADTKNGSYWNCKTIITKE